jgi:hypothetical protein
VATLAPSTAQVPALLIGCLLVTAPWPARAQERPALPSAVELRSLASELSALSQRRSLAEAAHARACTIRGAAVECRCVQHPSGWQIDVLRIDDAAGVITIEHASRLGEASASWAIGAATFHEDSWQLDDVWRWGNDDVMTLSVKRVTSTTSEAISARALAWYDAPPIRSALPCPAYRAPEAGMRLRAASASRAEDGWILKELEASWLELPGEQRTDEARSGLLPPTLRLKEDVFEYTHSASWTKLPMMVEAIISPRHWYGLGILFIGDEGAERPLEAAVLWSQDMGIGYALFGQAVLGSTSGAHISADMEQSGERHDMRELRSVEQRTWLRSWRSGRVGLGLSSESLMFIGSLSLDIAPWSAGSRLIGVSIGDSVQTGVKGSSEIRMEHWTSYGEEQATQHHSDVLVGWSQLWGDQRAIYARLGALGVMGLDAADGDEDWRAETRAGVAGYGEVGLHIVGRHKIWRHHVRPTLSTLVAPEGIETPGIGVARLLIEQRAEDAEGRWSINLPMGLWADWSSEARALQLLGGAAGWDGDLIRLRLTADVLCERWCARRHGMMRLSASQAEGGLLLEGSTGYSDSAANMLMQQSRGALGGMFGVEVMRRAADLTLGEAVTLHGAGAKWRGGRHELGGELWWSGAAGGALGSYEFSLREFGWGLGAQGGWSRDGSWSAWLGLKL